MNRSEFLERIEQIDRQLAEKGVPVYQRTLQVLTLLIPDYNGPLGGYGVNPGDYGEFEGPNLVQEIDDWYKAHYGDRSGIPFIRGRIPVLVRREVFLIRIPIVYGKPKIEIMKLVEGLTESLIKTLTGSELQAIADAFKEGYAIIYEMEDLMTIINAGKSGISISAQGMFSSAIADRDTAARCLDGRLDINGACFHSQQFGEKMLKAFLLAKANHTEESLKKKLGHNLKKIHSECMTISCEFADVTSDAGLLGNIPMDIRYSGKSEDPRVAVETVRASLRIGGLVACQIAGRNRRERPTLHRESHN
jgi:hypothetical protein